VEQTTELLKTCNKGIKMNSWESFFVHVLQQQDALIEEQRVTDLIPLYALAHVTR
jgi:trans-aconitate methyltransferase